MSWPAFSFSFMGVQISDGSSSMDIQGKITIREMEAAQTRTLPMMNILGVIFIQHQL
jgi:hypothetical protein